jgi:hypothetical protein
MTPLRVHSLGVFGYNSVCPPQTEGELEVFDLIARVPTSLGAASHCLCHFMRFAKCPDLRRLEFIPRSFYTKKLLTGPLPMIA